MNEHNTDLKLTRRKLLEELITSSMEKAMDKYSDKISEKISEKQKLRSDHKNIEFEIKSNARLWKNVMLSKASSTYILVAISICSTLIAGCYVTSYVMPNSLDIVPFAFEYLGKDVSDILVVLLPVLLLMELICFFCICCKRKKCGVQLQEMAKHGQVKKQQLSDIKRQYKKLENSMCVVSYSIDYVEKYHIPLAKSLMEYSNRKDLRIKRAVIREPEHLNSIPPSKIFIVFVDYNERNDLLEPVNPNAEQVPIRRETVRSLMDSMALVIFTYCMEQTSKKLPQGGRYAHKLSSKVLTIPELKELDEKSAFTVFTTASTNISLG